MYGTFTPIAVRVQQLHDDAMMPKRATPGAACFDLHSVQPALIQPGASASVGTGIAVEIPAGYVMLVFSRSGHGFKHGIRLVNSVGVIDSDYRGEIRVGLHNDGERAVELAAGERVAQAMILPFPDVAFENAGVLSATARGDGGFGSTGR